MFSFIEQFFLRFYVLQRLRFYKRSFFENICARQAKNCLLVNYSISLNYWSFRISKYVINWTINWLIRWWSNLIFCSTIVILNLMKLICFFRKSQNCFPKKINFVISSSRNRYLCQIQSNFETLLFNKSLSKLIR